MDSSANIAGPPALLAFGFGNMAMLGWLAAAAVPVLIHLWNRRRYREVSWAAMEYLLAALEKNARRLRLEQWCLLAVRMLILILVALAMGEPFLSRAGTRNAAGGRTLKVVVIDGSFSMAHVDENISRFDRAKSLARQLVEQSAQGDGFALVLMSFPAATIVSSPALEPQAFLKEIDALKLEDGGGDLTGAMDHAARILEQAKNSGFAHNEIYFISDLGKTSWQVVARGQASSDARQRVARLAQLASLVVLDVGQQGAANSAVTDVRASPSKPIVGSPVSITARIRAFGNTTRKSVPVELWIDGTRTAQQQIDLSGGTSTVAFNHRFESPAEHAADVRLASDGLEVDNHRYVTLAVREQLRVLCVDGKPAMGGRTSASYFLALALNPEESSSDRALDVEVASESALLERDITAYDCVFLCNVAQFTTSEARILDSYLKKGGGLVFFLGDQVIADRYNAELAAGGRRVLPARIGPPVGEAKYFFDPLDYRHPLVSVFKGRGQAGLLTTPVYRYFRLSVPRESTARVALAFEGGDPAIVEERLHRGQSIVVATDGSLSSFDPATGSPWTNMPAWPSYVPLVQELLSMAVNGQATEHNVQVGQTLSGSLTQAADLKVEAPDGSVHALHASARAASEDWTFSDTRRAGVYTVRGAPQGAKTLFAVNVDPRESDLARTARASLPESFTATAPQASQPLPGINTGSTRTVHKRMLEGALVLLLLELMLAWRFGHEAYARRPSKLA